MVMELLWILCCQLVWPVPTTCCSSRNHLSLLNLL